MNGPDDRGLTDRDFERLLAVRSGLRRFLRWSEAQAKAAGLTPAQHQLLLAIRGHRGQPSVGDVAEHLLLRHHSAVGLVDRAVSAGLIKREVDGSDHRVVRLALTAEGERRLRDLSAAHLEELERLSPGLRAVWSGLS
jgi:DNA-binding MarR family transcriptional regulator